MADSLEDLEKEFGGASQAPAGASSLEDLERSFATGADAIPRDKNTVPFVEKPKAPEFAPGFAGGAEKALAQIGAGMSDPILGVKQKMGKATEEDVAEKRRLDEALIGDSMMGKANFMLGKIAPSLAIPAMGGTAPAMMLYNALVGGLQGAVEPVGPGESAGLNMTAGALGGAAAPGIVSLVGSALKPAADAGSGLVRRALDMGIPLGPKDVTGSSFTKALASLLDDLPFTGASARQHKQDIATAITKNVAKTAGMDTEVLDQAATEAQKKLLSKGFDKLWKNTNVEMDANLFGAIQMANSRLDELAPETAATVRKQLQTMMDPNKIIQMPDGRLMLPGSLVNDIQQTLGSVAGTGKGVERNIAGGLQRELLDAFGRSTPPGSKEELMKLKGQWKALTKVIQPLVNSAEAGAAGREAGQIPLALLPNQAKVAYGDKLGTSPFADLAPIAGRYGVDRTPRTGGSMRALIQGAAAAGAGGLGTAVGMGALPLSTGLAAAALIPTLGMVTQKTLSSPAVTRRLAAEPVKQSLLGAPALRPALKNLTGTALSRGSAAGALGLAATAGRAAQPTASEEE